MYQAEIQTLIQSFSSSSAAEPGARLVPLQPSSLTAASSLPLIHVRFVRHDSAQGDSSQNNRAPGLPLAHSALHGTLRMAVGELSDLTHKLRPQDRCLAYLPPSVGPVHLFLRIEADFSQFGHLLGREDECIAEVLRLLDAFFESRESGISRPLDVRDLVLLQRSDAHCMRWRIHLPREAFHDGRHHAEFVRRVRQYIEEQTETRDAEAEADDELDEMPGSRGPFPVALCMFDPHGMSSDPQGTSSVRGSHHHVIHLPAGADEQLLVPYHSEPGTDVPLHPRAFRWQDGSLIVEPLAASSSSLSLPSPSFSGLLIAAHPGLSLPSASPYRFLVMASASKSQKRRYDDREGSDADDSDTDTAAAASKSSRSNEGLDRPRFPSVVPAPCVELTEAEWETVYDALGPHLFPEELRGACERLGRPYPSCTAVVRRAGSSAEETVQIRFSQSICPGLWHKQQGRCSANYPTCHEFIHYEHPMDVTLQLGRIRFECSDDSSHGYEAHWPMQQREWNLLKGFARQSSAQPSHSPVPPHASNSARFYANKDVTLLAGSPALAHLPECSALRLTTMEHRALQAEIARLHSASQQQTDECIRAYCRRVKPGAFLTPAQKERIRQERLELNSEAPESESEDDHVNEEAVSMVEALEDPGQFKQSRCVQVCVLAPEGQHCAYSA